MYSEFVMKLVSGADKGKTVISRQSTVAFDAQMMMMIWNTVNPKS